MVALTHFEQVIDLTETMVVCKPKQEQIYWIFKWIPTLSYSKSTYVQVYTVQRSHYSHLNESFHCFSQVVFYMSSSCTSMALLQTQPRVAIYPRPYILLLYKHIVLYIIHYIHLLNERVHQIKQEIMSRKRKGQVPSTCTEGLTPIYQCCN